MTEKHSDGYLDEIQGEMDGDVFKHMLELMCQRVMEEEMARHVGAQKHERAPERSGHRNGYKPRKLKTRVGELSMQVPQVRGMEPYSPLFLQSGSAANGLCWWRVRRCISWAYRRAR